MKKITNTIRIGMVRRGSVSAEPSEDPSSSSVLQQMNQDFVRKQNGGRRISRSAPLRDELHDQRHISTNKPPLNHRSRMNMNERQRLNTDMTTPMEIDEIPSKSKWSTKKKIIVGASIASVIAVVITVAVVLGVLLSASTGTTTTSSTTTTTVSPAVIIAAWSFDNVLTDSYGVYNGQLIDGAGFSPNMTNQPFVGYGEALFMNSSGNQSFATNGSFLDLTYKSLTIEAWIYPALLSSDRGIFGQCQCSTCANQCLYLIIRANHLYIGFTSNELSGTTVLSLNTWYHVAFVYNYQTQQQILYLNGAQEAIKSNAQPYQGKNGSIQIGSTQTSSGTTFFNGYIDNVMITTRAKAASEILRDASLMAYYSFDLPNPNADNGPNGLNGTSLNITTVAGRVNYAMRLLSVGAYFQSYGFYQFPYGVLASKPFSLSLWINPASISSSTIVQMFGTSVSNVLCTNFLGTYSAAAVVAQITLVSSNAGPSLLTGPFVTTNTWTHISVTYSSTNGYTLYVNGILYGASGSGTTTATNSLAYLFIGYFTSCAIGSANVAYYGSIDETYIHSRELTQSDVTGLANP